MTRDDYNRLLLVIVVEALMGDREQAIDMLRKLTEVGRIESVSGAWFNKPYTTVKWHDGNTTTVRCSEDDEYDMATGFLLCCAKRLLGGGRYLDVMRSLGIDIDGNGD